MPVEPLDSKAKPHAARRKLEPQPPEADAEVASSRQPVEVRFVNEADVAVDVWCARARSRPNTAQSMTARPRAGGTRATGGWPSCSCRTSHPGAPRAPPHSPPCSPALAPARRRRRRARRAERGANTVVGDGFEWKALGSARPYAHVYAPRPPPGDQVARVVLTQVCRAHRRHARSFALRGSRRAPRRPMLTPRRPSATIVTDRTAPGWARLAIASVRRGGWWCIAHARATHASCSTPTGGTRSIDPQHVEMVACPVRHLVVAHVRPDQSGARSIDSTRLQRYHRGPGRWMLCCQRASSSSAPTMSTFSCDRQVSQLLSVFSHAAAIPQGIGARQVSQSVSVTHAQHRKA